jgi:hypothetical protein
VAGAALAAGLLIGATVGAWLGWSAAVAAALLAWSRLRFRPSPGVGIWRRQAAMQRRTAAVLRPLAEQGHLVLHDITLQGWLDGLDHLVLGPTASGWSPPGGQRRGLVRVPDRDQVCHPRTSISPSTRLVDSGTLMQSRPRGTGILRMG